MSTKVVKPLPKIAPVIPDALVEELVQRSLYGDPDAFYDDPETNCLFNPAGECVSADCEIHAPRGGALVAPLFVTMAFIVGGLLWYFVERWLRS